MMELNKLYLMDCMEGMKDFPDNYFDLAIVDPPYGIGMGKVTKYRAKDKERYKAKEWDSATPNKEYFDELIRVSKDQVIWGGNYFTNYLTASRGWIYWEKGVIVDNYGSGELAWTSFDVPMKHYKITSVRWYHPDIQDGETRIHPTQKPKKLYRYILKDFATEKDGQLKTDFKIIDTHVGSASSIIVFLDFGCDWIGFEIDKDYHAAATKRIGIHKQQLKLF